MSPEGFVIINERTVFSGAIFDVVDFTVRSPDGEMMSREIVRHPGAVAIVALTNSNKSALLVSQFRTAARREILEIPAGTLDIAGEPPEHTAARELAEEVGHIAGKLEWLVDLFSSPGISTQVTSIYLARELTKAPHRYHATGAEERFMKVVEVDLADVDRLVAAGKIVDATTLCGLLMARERLTMMQDGYSTNDR